MVDNNIALRDALGIASMGLEFAKWNEEPWDWGFPNFTARNTTRELIYLHLCVSFIIVSL